MPSKIGDSFLNQFESDRGVVILGINGYDGGCVGMDVKSFEFGFQIRSLGDHVGFVINGIVIKDFLEAKVS